MQNNVTELTQRLLRSLDKDYNVNDNDMDAVVDIISHLEKVAITKELLETTRLGKHVNELRRKTKNESLSKRAKELIKKWKSMVLPDSNGQVKTSPPLQQQIKTKSPLKASPPLQQQIKTKSPLKASPPLQQQQIKTKSPSKASPPLQKLISPQVSPPLLANANSDVNLNQLKSKKRPAKESLDNVNAKRARLNGVTDLEFSDNSNSSFKDVKTEPKRDVIVINSDSNSSFPEKLDPQLDQLMPKKRGRKKGSKNHKNLIDDAESSFTNKLAVSASRGNSKVKTTQELLASIQNKNCVVKPKEDLIEKAAKLTERVSIIDQKLNTNANRNKGSTRNRGHFNQRIERVIESGSVINDKSLLNQFNNEDEIINVDEIEPEVKSEVEEESEETEQIQEDANVVRSLSIEEARALLPPIDKSVLLEDEDEPRCSCYLKENKPDFSIDEEEIETGPPFEFVEDHSCRMKEFLTKKYHLDSVSDEMVHRLHTNYIPNVNGNPSLGPPKPDAQMLDNGLYVNVVPNIYEKLDRDANSFSGENFKKYSVSEECDNKEIVIKSEERTGIEGDEDNRDSDSVFREWYDCLDRPSYSGEVLKILPYVIID